MIDLRSDTVTRPTAAMLQAMMAAPVGDDVMGDDPSVNRLQAAVAERAGKEAGLFFPSGTQSNLAALMAHCERGDEYLVGQLAHTYRYEGGGAAVLGSIQPQPIEHAADGTLPLERLAEAVKPKGDPHYARTRLLALENTFRKLIPATYIEAASAWARGLGLGVHLDGARVFTPPSPAAGRWPSCARRSTRFLFFQGAGRARGLGAGRQPRLIERALRWRKMLGGGLRQSGVLAAACLYALEHNVERLAQDHEHARLLAEGLRGIAGLRVLSQDTNMVFVEFEPSRCDALNAGVAADGILMRAVYGGSTRLVTHLDVSADDVRRVVASVARHLA